MKKMLCAVDDTEPSKAAVALAAELAKATGAELTLLAVNALIGGIGGKGGAASYLWENAELKRLLHGASSEAKKAGVTDPTTADLKSRDVARAITSYAEENEVDHIVIGSAGKGAVARLMLGSVSRDVVFRAYCPVTVAR